MSILLIIILITIHGIFGERKIFNGDYVDIKELPFMVLLSMKVTKSTQSTGRCAGSYIHKFWVLSAAHCVRELSHHSKLYCCMGSEYARLGNCKYEREVGFIIYPRHSKKKDLAMLKLKSPFEFGPTIQLGKLPVKQHGISLEELSQFTCKAAGWGRTEREVVSDILLQAVVEVKSKCYSNFICVKSVTQGPCKGDSGSPLICNGIIYGVLSTGSVSKCGVMGSSAAYVKVDEYLDFINDCIAGKYGTANIPMVNTWILIISSFLLRI